MRIGNKKRNSLSKNFVGLSLLYSDILSLFMCLCSHLECSRASLSLKDDRNVPSPAADPENRYIREGSEKQRTGSLAFIK